MQDHKSKSFCSNGCSGYSYVQPTQAFVSVNRILLRIPLLHRHPTVNLILI